MQYDLKKTGKIIRGERKKLNLTQDQLGKLLHISGKQISNYEKGVLLPPQDILLVMASLFNCEYGYLLGEESYKEGSKLDTAICESLGLSYKAIDALRSAAHKGLTKELPARQQALNKFFESPYFPIFIDCLVNAININNELVTFNNAHYQDLVNRYGEELVNQATLCYSFNDGSRAEILNNSLLQDVYKEFETIIDKEQAHEYALKVARYELRESFEHLIRTIK